MTAMRAPIGILCFSLAVLPGPGAPRAAALPLPVSSPSTAPAALTAKVVEDTPGRLVLELTLPAASLHPVAGAEGFSVHCPGCHSVGRAGAPDLPVYRFDVLTGANDPRVTVQALASDSRILPEGIAPFPETPTPNREVFRPEAALYRAASGFQARLLAKRKLRGLAIRGIEVPLAAWDQGGKSLLSARRLRVEVVFPGAFASASPLRLTGAFRLAVLNPDGGAFLSGAPRRLPLPALRKGAATAADIEPRFVRIKVGDHNAENFQEDQVYSLSFSQLSAVTADINAARVSRLRLFGGPNDTLPRRMDTAVAPVSGTLKEIPIQVIDADNNGTFDHDDRIVFYAHGASIWKRLADTPGPIRWEFSEDTYSFENYYYLDWTGTQDGSRLSESASMPATGTPVAASLAYLRAEKDLATAGCDPSGHKDEEAGYDWHWHWKGGCSSGSNNDTLLSRASLLSAETDSLPDLTSPSDSVYIGFHIFRANAESTTIFKPYYGGDGDTADFIGLTASPGSWFAITRGIKNAPAFQLDGLAWGGNENKFEGYTVAYKRNHVFRGEPLWLFPERSGIAVSFKVTGGAGAKCLRVEHGVAGKLMVLDGQGVFTDSVAAGSDARYLVYQDPAALTASALEADALPAAATSLRNLVTGDGKSPDYLIITDRSLLAQALMLRDYRNAPKRALKLNSEVVCVEDIYRQFSGGRLSPTAIRDFLRWAYGGWGSQSKAGALKYVLFFGDGHYDYRNIRASLMKKRPPNVVPPYEFIVDNGHEDVASDDFYGLLEPAEFGYGGGALQVALGRVPVQDPVQAKDYLKKISDYEDPKLAGEWRGRIVMTADDNIQRGANEKDYDPITQGHTTDADQIGLAIAGNEKGITVDKVYLLDYPMNSSYHKPEAAQDLLTLINRGTLMINYVGHGASNQWADEVLLQTNDAIARMRNEGRTPMVNAFSCTVGRFESLSGEGMSEQFVKQKSVGAIGAVSATRESFPHPNIQLADAFYARVFPGDSTGITVTVGEALREAKNSSETNADNLNDIKYNLLGEPVLLMRKPQLKLALTQVMDTIKALDCRTIKGTVQGGLGNGKVNIKIVAGTMHKTYNLPGGFTPQEVEKRGNILFERTLPYKNGAFESDYFIPKQVSFGDTNAQVLVFAWDDSLEMEGTMARQNLPISGTSSACAMDSDGKGPRIRISGCEQTETGDVDFPDHVKLPLPYCLQISVEDSLGGVLSSEGPDEGTTLEIPGLVDPFHPAPGVDDLYIKTYQYSLDKKGIRPGAYLLKVSARDGYGNIGARQLQMDLTVDSSITTVTAYNVPNPMKRKGTTFYFSTSIPSNEVEYGGENNGKQRLFFEIRIFDQAGRLVKVFQDAASGTTTWDGHDRWGNLLANGVYFYSITARQDLFDVNAKPGYRTLSSKRNTLVISR